MRAVRLRGVRDLRLEGVPEPHPGPGEVAVEVEAVGVCASDLHYYLHGSIGGLTAANGLILGHEFAGRIVEVGSPSPRPMAPPLPLGERPHVQPIPPGPTVQQHSTEPSPPEGEGDAQRWVRGRTHAAEGKGLPLRIGQRVAVEPVRPCGNCRECARGDYHLCRTLKFFGTPPTNGALCERVICPAEWAFPLPKGMSAAEGAMMEPLAVGVYAAELAGLRGGETAAVVGCGAIGLSTLQTLKVSGATILYAEDPIVGREALAVSLGAGPKPCPPHTADVAAECAGTPEALNRCLELVRPGGTVLLVGIPDEDLLTMPASVVRRKGLTLKFVRRYRHCFPRAVRWTSEGKIDVSSYLTHRFPLERTAEAFDLAASRKDGVIRAWIDLTGEAGNRRR